MPPRTLIDAMASPSELRKAGDRGHVNTGIAARERVVDRRAIGDVADDVLDGGQVVEPLDLGELVGAPYEGARLVAGRDQCTKGVTADVAGRPSHHDLHVGTSPRRLVARY